MWPTRHPHRPAARQTNNRITGVLGPNKLTSCPISRADSNLNRKCQPPVDKTLSPCPSSLSSVLPCSLLPLLVLLGAPTTHIGVCYVGGWSYALERGVERRAEMFPLRMSMSGAAWTGLLGTSPSTCTLPFHTLHLVFS